MSADLSGQSVDLALVNGDSEADVGDVAHALALMRFAEAIASRDEAALLESRNTLEREAGAAVVIDAAAVAGNFQRMVRIADSTGIPLDNRALVVGAGLRKELDLGRFASAANTPQAPLKTRLLGLVGMPLARYMLRKQAKR